ncbi:enoyl-CoA delta isomerase 2-like [Oppia nitens]|uniref:enoyl-CoA delta isomerase 2-like n=1 Tax=Oppia nitens TaxID=1686743 RepID=UPI0023DC1CB1|nr:enoyl-CoA delta isomerase 2-like [Oppia nitens]
MSSQKSGQLSRRLMMSTTSTGTTTTTTITNDTVAKQPTVLLSKRMGVSIIRLNRPHKYNAWTQQMYDTVANGLTDAATDESIKLALITGTGSFYSAGNDLKNYEKAFKQFDGDMNRAADEQTERFRQFVAAFIDFPKPLIAAVNGPAIGVAATTLALVDCAVASDSAYFSTPFSSLGLSAEGCSTYTFPQIMGQSMAAQMLYFNHKMSATEALQSGLVSRVIPSAQFDEYIENWIFADRTGIVNTCYPQSMRASKQLVRSAAIRQVLHEVNRSECLILKQRSVSDECLEAIQKFFIKNKL